MIVAFLDDEGLVMETLSNNGLWNALTAFIRSLFVRQEWVTHFINERLFSESNRVMLLRLSRGLF